MLLLLYIKFFFGVCGFAQPTTAWVEVQISTSCSSTSSTQRVNFGVGAVPSPSVYADWDNPLKIIAGADPVNGATSYKWYVNNVYIKSTTNPNTSLPYNGDCYTSVTVGVEVVNAYGTSVKTNTNIGTAPRGNFSFRNFGTQPSAIPARCKKLLQCKECFSDTFYSLFNIGHTVGERHPDTGGFSKSITAYR